MDSDELCNVCLTSGCMTMLDGVLVCTVCGTQSQAVVQETQEALDGPRGPRHEVTLRVEKRTRPREIEGSSAGSLIRAYCFCLQETLTALCQHVEKKLAVDRALTGIARRMWFAKVAHSGVLELQDSSNFRTSAVNVGGVEGARIEEYRLLKHENVLLTSKLHQLLAPDMVLVILYLAALVLRTTLTPMDLISSALSGDLPFFKEVAAACERHDADGKMSLSMLLRPPGVMGLYQLLKQAAAMATALEIALPPINAEALLERYCSDLALPLEVSAGVRVILECYQSGGGALLISQDSYQNPYGQLMAMLVFVIKSLYLGSSPVKGSKGFDWCEWAKTAVTLSSHRHLPGIKAEQCDYDDPDAASKRLLSSVFAEFKVPPKFEEHQQTLSKISAAWAAKSKPATPHPQPMTVPQGHQMTYPEVRKQLDYASLCTGTASYVWLKPTYMHKYVAQISKELLLMEGFATKKYMDQQDVKQDDQE